MIKKGKFSYITGDLQPLARVPVKEVIYWTTLLTFCNFDFSAKGSRVVELIFSKNKEEKKIHHITQQ